MVFLPLCPELLFFPPFLLPPEDHAQDRHRHRDHRDSYVDLEYLDNQKGVAIQTPTMPCIIMQSSPHDRPSWLYKTLARKFEDPSELFESGPSSSCAVRSSSGK